MITLPTRPPYRDDPAAVRGFVARMDAELATALAARPWNPAELRGPMILAIDNAAKRASADDGDPAIAVDLDRAACLGAGLFAGLVAGPGGSVETPLPGGQAGVSVSGAAASPNIGEPLYWRDALLAALAARNGRAVTILAEVPLALLRGLAPEYPDWFFLEAEALQAFALRRKDAPERILAAARAADPNTVEEFSRDMVLDIVSPELQLAFRTLDRDQASFDQWMIEAIKGHHHYYDSDDQRRRLPLSQLALAPLAMACVAYDLGIRTNVESDYLPRHIIRV